MILFSRMIGSASTALVVNSLYGSTNETITQYRKNGGFFRAVSIFSLRNTCDMAAKLQLKALNGTQDKGLYTPGGHHDGGACRCFLWPVTFALVLQNRYGLT